MRPDHCNLIAVIPVTGIRVNIRYSLLPMPKDLLNERT